MNNNSLSDFFNTGLVRLALVGVFGILAIFLLAETISVTKSFGREGNPATDVVTVQGTGQATLPPDVARISFSVVNTASSVAEAQSATTKQANAALAFIKEQGIAEKDVRTLSYNISPQYSYPNPCRSDVCPVYSDNTPKITGYQVSETVEVKIRNLSSVGTFVAGLGKLEVQNVSGPDFTLDDTTSGYNAARADAIEKAKTQANLLAKQLGIHLGKIVNFSESTGGNTYPVYAMDSGMGGGMKAAAPSLPAGENTYNASVSITYEIR